MKTVGPPEGDKSAPSAGTLSPRAAAPAAPRPLTAPFPRVECALTPAPMSETSREPQTHTLEPDSVIGGATSAPLKAISQSEAVRRRSPTPRPEQAPTEPFRPDSAPDRAAVRAAAQTDVLFRELPKMLSHEFRQVAGGRPAPEHVTEGTALFEIKLIIEGLTEGERYDDFERQLVAEIGALFRPGPSNRNNVDTAARRLRRAFVEGFARQNDALLARVESEVAKARRAVSEGAGTVEASVAEDYNDRLVAFARQLHAAQKDAALAAWNRAGDSVRAKAVPPTALVSRGVLERVRDAIVELLR